MANENKNATLDLEELDAESFDYDALEKELEADLGDLQGLKEDELKIGNPDALGDAVTAVIWDQFLNQVGAVAGEDFIKENRGMTLDLRDEAHIQTTENFAEGKIASHNTEIDYQERYDKWQDNFQRNEDGTVTTKMDKRSGKEKEVLKPDARKDFDKDRPKGSKTVNKDHTVSAAEIIRDPEAAAHLDREEQIKFANSEKNLFIKFKLVKLKHIC